MSSVNNPITSKLKVHLCLSWNLSLAGRVGGRGSSMLLRTNVSEANQTLMHTSGDCLFSPGLERLVLHPRVWTYQLFPGIAIVLLMTDTPRKTFQFSLCSPRCQGDPFDNLSQYILLPTRINGGAGRKKSWTGRKDEDSCDFQTQPGTILSDQLQQLCLNLSKGWKEKGGGWGDWYVWVWKINSTRSQQRTWEGQRGKKNAGGAISSMNHTEPETQFFSGWLPGLSIF